MGMRAEESLSPRARKPPWRLNERNSRAGRTWFDWLLIFHLSEQQVFRIIRDARQSPHPAYAVGIEAYEASGGQVLRDLFAQDDGSGVWFEDPVLLAKLATEKLQAAANELATRWKWAVAMVEVDWNTTARYGRIEPQPAERTPEVQAEIERLEARQTELAELDDEAWTEELLAEAETIETRLRVRRRIFRTTCSAGSLAPMDFCLISVPFGHYDELEILHYKKTSACPIGADVRQTRLAGSRE